MLLQNLRYGFRLAARKPAFALVAVFILALGIAVNSAMFSVLNTLLFHAVPYRDAPRILAIYQANPERGVKQQLVSIPDYFDWRRDNPAFDGPGPPGTSSTSTSAAPISRNAFRA